MSVFVCVCVCARALECMPIEGLDPMYNVNKTD